MGNYDWLYQAYPKNFKVIRDMEEMVEQRVLIYSSGFDFTFAE